MKISIMQPYFFPYIGYFSLIKNTDQFILFDTVQFIRHGWIERNRILKPQLGWQYIGVPLSKKSSKSTIQDVRINNKTNWQGKLLAQLQHYKKKSPYYKQTINIVESAINITTDSLVDLNANILNSVCFYLDIPFNFRVYSQMDLKIEEVKAPDEWALNICKALGNINEYWNPPGGEDFFDKKKYEESNIKLYFQNVKINPYSQRRGAENIETGLSVIDVMMFNSPSEIRDMLDNYELF